MDNYTLVNFTFIGILNFHNVDDDVNFFDSFEQSFITNDVVPTARDNRGDVAFGMIQLIEWMLGLFFNASLFLIIIACKNLRRKKSNQFFLNLLLVHIVLCISGVVSSYYSSNAYVILNNGLALEMFFSLIISTCDRFVFIKFPFKHGDLTTRNVLLLLALSWTPSLLFVSVALVIRISQFHLALMMTVMISVATFVLSVSNINIYIMAKKHDRFIKENGTPSKRSTTTESTMIRASWVCFAVVFSFVVLWFPYIIHNVLAMMNFYNPDGKKLFTNIAERVAFLTCILDPLLFVWLSRGARKEVRKVGEKMHALKNKMRKVGKKLQGVNISNVLLTKISATSSTTSIDVAY